MSKDDEKPEFDEKQSGPILEAMKKLFSVGLGAAFMTEESIRSYLGDLKLPKEIMTFILQSASKGKEELIKRVGNEIGTLISHIDVVKEVGKFAENHKFKVSAEIEVVAKDKKAQG